MTLSIDGYTPPDNSIAFTQGVQFEYATKFGVVTITSKHTGRENTKWRSAIKKHNEFVERRRTLDSVDDREAERRFIEVVHDTLVLSWSTTIKSGGNPIEASKENFVELMTNPATSNVLSVYLRDASDEQLFQASASDEKAAA